jgi:septal ring factor EnvC (AmiA/AmiB activator)
MNVESLKSELQQVLDNDVVLRKEFNELKRSLSDYRNQLIMRDEDCKRLQVTIDVLNTKLVVIERDNTNYKAELTSFKELRGTI